MEVITMEADAYQKLFHKVTLLLNRLEKNPAFQQAGFSWIDNTEFCKLLGVTKRTSQNYRDRRMVSFSQIGSKIYYKSTDVEAFLQKHHIKSTSNGGE